MQGNPKSADLKLMVSRHSKLQTVSILTDWMSVIDCGHM
jgi:hypothetical protein